MQRGKLSKRRFLAFAIGAIFCLLAVAGPAFAQGTTGAIDIQVLDSTGSAVPGASVTVANVGTGVGSKAQSDDVGRCQFPLLRAGTYLITVEQAGFDKLVRSDVIVNATTTTHLDLRLTVGARSDTVTVAAETPLLQTDQATMGNVVEERQLTSTPLASRNFTQLLGTSAGIVGGIFNADNPGTGGANVSVNGARNGSNALMVDGAPADNALNLAPDGDGTPSLEFLSEFRVLSHAFSAEFGRASGAVVNVTTRSGTNDFHGGAYEFLRNTVLSSRPFFNPKKGTNIQNQFGGNIGGPIRRNKTFFFGGWESSRQRNGNSGSSTYSTVVPTAAMRAGNFGSINITDPTTGTLFPNNVIPSSRFAAAGVGMQTAFVPLPNYNSGGATNYFAQQTVPTNIDEYTVRVDHRIGDKDSLWGRWFDSREHDVAPFCQGPGFPCVTHRNKLVLAVNYTHVFTPTLVLETSFAWNQTDQFLVFTNQVDMKSVGLNPVASALQNDGIGYMTINNYLSFGNQQRWTDHVKTGVLRGDFNYNRGKHTVKFGGEIRPDLYDDANTLDSRGGFTFTGTATGNAYADFLTGYTRTKVFGAGPGRVMDRDWGSGFYVTDEWRVAPRVTVTLGARWEPFWQPAAYNFNRTNWWPDKYTGMGSLAASGIVQGGVNGVSPSTVNNDMNNIMPRVGIAWRVTDKWVIRSGGGLFFDQRTGQIAQQAFRNPPGYTSVTIDCGVAGSSCNLKSPDNFTFVDPGYNPTSIPFPTFATQGLSYSSLERDTKTDNSWQWNFTVQRQLPGDTLLEAAYVGSKGSHLMANYSGNPSIPIGFDPKNPQAGTLVPEYPGFAANSITGQGADSHYESLQLTVKKRVASGTVQAAYTNSKSISNGGDSSTRFYTSMGLTPWWDWSRARGLSAFDRPQRLSVMFSQDLPKPVKSGPAKWIVNNWSFSGLATVQSGTPLTVTNATSGQGLGGSATSTSSALFANVVNGMALINPGSVNSNLYNYIDKAAWSKAPTGTVGNSGIGMFRGPGQFDVDFSIFKSFPIRERKKVEFRTEIFNILNHPNFSNPNTSLDSASFGQISGTTVNGRIIQFALKLAF